MPIPIIDLFAGPGGLNEGFSRVTDATGRPAFSTLTSVEMEATAHKTLELRALFRRLDEAGKRDYRDYTIGLITRDRLFEKAGPAGTDAKNEAMMATLGKSPAVDAEIESRIGAALRKAGTGPWVLIGGPPCQAYSLMGRSRRANEPEKFAKDKKHTLYREYLRIVQKFAPAAFLMENVPGLLSATLKGQRTFGLIAKDFDEAGYDLHALGGSPDDLLSDPTNYVLNAEEYGVPQARSRVFILGVRKGSGLKPGILAKAVGGRGAHASVTSAIGDLPKIRSRLSKEKDSGVAWQAAIQAINGYAFKGISDELAGAIRARSGLLRSDLPLGKPFMEREDSPQLHRAWYQDFELPVVLNHNSRGHMTSDLLRYFFWAEYARKFKKSPKLSDAPFYLRPNHDNVQGTAEDAPFADRFRVQISDRPSTTVTSHISKDGHYYIHPDSLQCRSLSVREAARLQTFPDSYFFEGNITAQYGQVGNAVPPYLAKKLGDLIFEMVR
jgi:DNA (cytosine-5)-methyltransferase 1